VTLFQHPDQLAELKADPEKWAAPFVEELCRYHTASAMAIKRTTKEDVEIGGKVSHPSWLYVSLDLDDL
jgi:nitric oxide reductase